ncbi:type VI secretion system protein TssL, short form [Pseudomonas nunensis]|uniref:Type VI secretion system protein TssL, short form n=1 Tax=Pseudomonas nunensis TaxID=2961896 RepID=A0ABY5EPR8_9PSED|nr:type VI secretion system protein TssL, short form [Pseudomonas nunensis]KPN90931.1 type IV secretion protein DotU [Pseudomonas nunensis]MCL5228291.1 type VI secretion system protein TssL, short form [Pseudomonas nunensis]UTO17198.1 type VI secretion system protein TssL, short form [Pseudomonas nunensis]
MNLTASKEQSAAAVHIDALLQDTYLLVVELRQGASVRHDLNLSQFCVEQVDQVRQQLKLAGLNQRSIDHISHAQCALLDEVVLTCAKGDAHGDWASKPLQAKFFNRHQAGEFLYEDMRDVLREPAPDHQVLTAFQRVLMLGFRGRYSDLADPEREQLLEALNAQVAPLKVGRDLITQVGAGDLFAGLAWLRSPLIHVLAVVVLFAATWWATDHLLSGAIASLLPDQV